MKNKTTQRRRSSWCSCLCGMNGILRRVWRGHNTNLHTEIVHEQDQLAICVWVLARPILMKRSAWKLNLKVYVGFGRSSLRNLALFPGLTGRVAFRRQGAASPSRRVFLAAAVALRLVGVTFGDPHGSLPLTGALDLGLAGNLCCLHHSLDPFAPWWDGVDSLLLGLEWRLPPLAASIFQSYPRCEALCRCDGIRVRFGELVGWIQHAPTEDDRKRKEVGEENGKIP